MDALNILDGQSPLIILLFLSFAMLVVMFFLMVRMVDDVRKGVRAAGEGADERLAGLHAQLEDLIRVEYEILNAIKPQAGAAAAPRPTALTRAADDAGAFELGAPGTASRGKAKKGEDLLQGNITDFILDE
ncbi:MAG: hypothetical protein H0S85_02700 [Desulfovibrionaceae bacterium]|jgi:hypothetical protein|nr:hypothetical protein [Desulfovibrionaceae bacterium]